MREDERNGNWFAVESKSFEFTTEGKGKNVKCFITERSKGVVSWIRFGIEGMVKLLMGVEECCRAIVPVGRIFVWRENGRSFRLESKENKAGRFLLCSVTDGEGKRHWLVFPEGRGFLNGWTLLAGKIRGMGFKPRQEKIPMRTATVGPAKGGVSLSKNIVTWGGKPALKDVDEGGSSVKNAVWVDVGDYVYGKDLGSLQCCLIGRWKTNPEPYPRVEELEVWLRETWRLNEGLKLDVLNKDLLILEFNSPEKAKWVLESGRRSFKGGVLQLDWWSPESGCLRSKGSMQEAWIRVVGLPLHLWTTEILRKLGDACGGFVAVDELTEMRKEVKWARLLIKLSGKARPSVVNILEGPRSYELQIWWEILPWVTGVYPVNSRLEGKNPKEEDEVGARAVERVGCSRQSCNNTGQKAQESGTRKKVGSGRFGSGVVKLVSEALMRRSDCGTYGAGMGEGKHRLIGLSAGANFVANGSSRDRSICPADQREGAHKTVGGADRIGGLSGLVSTGRRGGSYAEGLGVGRHKQAGLAVGVNLKVNGPSPDCNRSPVEQRDGVLKSVAGADRIGGSDGPVSTGPMQAGPLKCSKALKPSNWGKKGLDSGVTYCPKEEKRLEDESSHLGAVCSLNSLVDPAWICMRGPLLHVQEGRLGSGVSSGFESCWEDGMRAVSPYCPSTGNSHQDHEEDGDSEARSFAIVEVFSECPEEEEPEDLGILANGSSLETMPSGDFSSPFLSVFGRPLLSGDSSGLGEILYEAVGEMEPLRMVSADGREWGKGIVEDPNEGSQAVVAFGSLSEESPNVSPDCKGYNSWEDSCLIKFSEYLGITTTGFEEEILELLRKMEVQQQGEKRKGYPFETKCERELRKLECTINYDGKGQIRGGRDRGNFLLKLK